MVRSSTSVLLVEDEDSYIDDVTLWLGRDGFVVTVVRDATEAGAVFESVRPDVVLLDGAMANGAGLAVCRSIRTRSSVPIVLVAAPGRKLDAVLGLELGADDCLSRPERLRELSARLRAVLRRRAPMPNGSAPDGIEVFEAGDVRVDVAKYEVLVRGTSVQLPLKEFQLLAVLLANANRVVTRSQLMDRVWGLDYGGDSKTLDVHVKRLRAKIELDPSTPQRITTVRGLGYRYIAPRASS
jgi:two-component system, OmpR family, response regulator RegX3